MTNSPTVSAPRDTSRAASSMQITVPSAKISAWPELSTPSEV